MIQFHDQVKMKESPRGGYELYIPQSETLSWQQWRSSSLGENGYQCCGDHLWINPPDNAAAVIFFFADTKQFQHARETEGRDEECLIDPVGYQAMGLRAGQWTHYLSGLTVNTRDQWTLSVEGLSFTTKPKGVFSEAVLLDFLAGRHSISDLILLDWRFRSEPKLQEALSAIRRLKSAMGREFRSSSAAKAQSILEEVLAMK